jgi:AraC-like DNA-binding protein
MIILSIRIGKSVLLGFSKSLDPIFIYLGLCLLLFIGPLFYLYCSTLISKTQAVAKSGLIHFLPGILLVFAAIPLQIFGFNNLSAEFTSLLFLVLYAHFLGYILMAKKQYFSRSVSSARSKEVRQWLNTLFYGLLCIWIVYVLNLFEERIPYILGPIVYSLAVYTITYLAVVKKYLQQVNTVKYQTTTFSETETKSLFEQIENLVKEQNLFLESEISLTTLSKRLKASTQKISFTINTKAGCNFNEYINRHRVAYAIELLNKAEGKNFTIASIGTEAGFNSLSSFNQAFKKVTGKTPSRFRFERVDD